MRGLIVALLVLSVPVVAGAAQVLTIDDFSTYAEVADLQAAYAPLKGTPPAEFFAHGDKQALKIPCPSATVPGLVRGGYDVKVNLDLSQVHAIAFDLYCDSPAGVSGFSIFLHSGNGWWVQGVSTVQGWQHFSIPRGTFEVDGGRTPDSWGKIDMIRLSAWPGEPLDTFCALDNLQGRTEDVAMVLGTQKGVRGGGGSGHAAGIMSGLLGRAGIAYDQFGEADVESGLLSGVKLALFPFSPELSDKAMAQVDSFVAGGGKAVFCYVVPQRIGDILGVAPGRAARRASPDDFAEVDFAPGALPGLPPRIAQDASFTNSFTASAAHHARVIGTWRSRQGQDQGPAVLVSDNGAYIGYFLSSAEPTAPKQAFLAALVGHFVPGAWETMATQAVAAAGEVRPFAGADEFNAFLDHAAQDPEFGPRVAEALRRAETAATTMDALVAGRQYPAARLAAQEWHESLVRAFATAHRPRAGEFRCAFDSFGLGDGSGWDATMRHLHEAGFNAVMPSVGSASLGVVYASEVLPRAKVVAEKGDQLAQCAAAARQQGIEVHACLAIWCLYWAKDAGAAFCERLRAEHRLQVQDDGKEAEWLCPSDPRNFALLRDACLEIVRKYDVDGLNLDYIRYPETGHTCYCEGCRERFEAIHGVKVANWPADCYSGALKAAYRQFRCDQITRLVKAVSEEAHRLKPYVKVSADAIGDHPKCKDDMGQDWVLWCQQGYLDFVCPMTYRARDNEYQELVGRLVELVDGAVPFYSGLGTFNNPDDGLIGQMEIARRVGADGFYIHSLGADMAAGILPKLALGMTATPTTAPHQGPRVRFERAGPGAVKVSVLGPGQHRQPVKSFTGRLELQDAEGKKVGDLGALPETGQAVQVQLKLTAITPGLRLAAVGTMVFADGTSRSFVVRSQPSVITLR